MPVLFTLFFLYKQQLTRHEMKERLEEEMLHTIIVPDTDIQWVKFKKEVRIKGKMFDIKSFSFENGQFIFTGLYDEEETALNNYFEKHTGQNEKGTNQLLSSLFKMLQSIYGNDVEEAMPSAAGSVSFPPLIFQHTSSPFRDILTPPPQLVTSYCF